MRGSGWSPRSERVLLVLKTAWVLASLIALGVYVWRHQKEFGAYVFDLSVWSISGAALALVAGRFGLAMMMRESLGTVGRPVSRRHSFVLYTATDVGKYLPGGFWGVISRFVVYARERMGSSEMLRAFALENAWVVSSAFFLGAAFLLVGASESNVAFLHWSTSLSSLARVGVCLLLGGGWILVLQVTTRLLLGRFLRVAEIFRVAFGQFLISVCLGLSLGLLLAGEHRGELMWLSIGAFTIARPVGYLAFFAPAGIGVREAVILVVMAEVAPLAVLVALTAVHRLVTIVTEAICFAFVARAFVSDAITVPD